MNELAVDDIHWATTWDMKISEFMHCAFFMFAGETWVVGEKYRKNKLPNRLKRKMTKCLKNRYRQLANQ